MAHQKRNLYIYIYNKYIYTHLFFTRGSDIGRNQLLPPRELKARPSWGVCTVLGGRVSAAGKGETKGAECEGWVCPGEKSQALCAESVAVGTAVAVNGRGAAGKGEAEQRVGVPRRLA